MSVIYCKLVILVAEVFASPNIPVVTGDSLGSSTSVYTKAYGKQENLFQTNNNFCVILLSSLLHCLLLVEKQYLPYGKEGSRVKLQENCICRSVDCCLFGSIPDEATQSPWFC